MTEILTAGACLLASSAFSVWWWRLLVGHYEDEP